MDDDRILEFEQGRIGFAGGVRTPAEYGIDLFQIELPNRRLLYGEWRAKFAENGNDFNIEIASFGYPDKVTTSNGYYEIFDAKEKIAVEYLIEKLFDDAELKKNFWIFKNPEAHDFGFLIYKSGWIVLKTDYKRNIQLRWRTAKS